MKYGNDLNRTWLDDVPNAELALYEFPHHRRRILWNDTAELWKLRESTRFREDAGSKAGPSVPRALVVVLSQRAK